MSTTTVDKILLECDRLKYSKPLEAYSHIQRAVKKAIKSKDLLGLALANEQMAILARVTGDPAIAQSSAQSALLYFRATKNIRKEANCLLLIGRNTYDKGDLPKALGYYKEAERLVKNVENNELILARSYGLQGNILLTQGKPAEALKCLLRSLNISEQYDLKLETGVIYQGLASFYILEEDYEKALSYSSKALPIFVSLNDKYHECFNLNSLGMIYSRKNDAPKANKCYTQAVKIANQLGMIYMTVWSQSNLIEWHIKENHTTKATRLIKKLLLLLTNKLDVVSRAMIYYTAGSFYMLLNKPELAIKNLRSATQQFSTSQYGKLQVLEKLLEIFIRIDDADNSIKTLQEYLALKDEIFSTENRREISLMEANQEAQLKSVVRDKQLEKYSLHRFEKNEFVQSFKQKYKENKNTKISFEYIDSQIKQNTEQFDHELYISMTYNDFLMRLSKRFPDLSSTELKIATLLRLNMSSKRIASLLSISIRTVEYHRTNIRRKLHLRTKDNVQLFLMKI